ELLLQQSGNSVTGVAFEVGYSDADYFSRQFKKFYGVTPSEYQRENR
ncbi:MAG: AraC family transcriptional regulator, partial [Prolixibacteraceae bacterium]|nr:AraC family transcriptional regulator [Prolixibacteraceae bacterium]